MNLKLRKTLGLFRRLSFRDALVCAIDELTCREVVRTVKFRDVDLTLRTYSPDLLVAFSCLQDSKYKSLKLQDPAVIIDGGANIGASSIYFAKRFPAARIIAVEPEATNYALLLRNTQRYANITCVNAAIWGSEGVRDISNRMTGHWGYTVSETQKPSAPTGQAIQCLTISNLMDQFGIPKIDLLKLDIEGGEKDVLQNASGWIGSVDTLTVELHDRICPGCTEAFRSATSDFSKFESHGEKVTAYR